MTDNHHLKNHHQEPSQTKKHRVWFLPHLQFKQQLLAQVLDMQCSGRHSWIPITLIAFVSLVFVTGTGGLIFVVSFFLTVCHFWSSCQKQAWQERGRMELQTKREWWGLLPGFWLARRSCWHRRRRWCWGCSGSWTSRRRSCLGALWCSSWRRWGPPHQRWFQL